MHDFTALTLASVVDNSIHRFAARPALSFVGGAPMSYQDLGVELGRVRAALRRLGIRPGDRVAILGANMPNWGVAFFAITSMGAVAVPLLPDFHEREIQTFLDHAGCDAMFVSAKQHARIRDLAVPRLRHVILLESFELLPADCVEAKPGSHSPIWTEAVGEVPSTEVHEDDLASIIYTSGTTGKSKGVMLTHRNIVFNAVQVQTIQPVQADDVFLSILPLSHTYENTLGLVLPVMRGASVWYLDKPPTPNILLPALEKVRPTLMLSVPLVIEKIYKQRVLKKFTGSALLRRVYDTERGRKFLHRMAGKKLMKTFGGRLHFFGIGGAKLDPNAERFLREARFPYAVGYGLTETAPMLAGANPQNVRYQSTGPAMEGVELRIANADSVTGEGEIEARSLSVMRGYYNEPELTREAFTHDGWFRTGDLGVFDADGHLYIKGRLKNLIIGAGGENIYPEEIEHVINNYEYVVESLVVEMKGRLVALVHLNYEELETQLAHLRDEAVHFIQEKVEGVLRDIHLSVNSNLNRFSQLSAVREQRLPFEKTATQKIKRFLYRGEH